MNSQRMSPQVDGRPLFLCSISLIGNGVSARQGLGSVGTVSGQSGELSGCFGAAHPCTLRGWEVSREARSRTGMTLGLSGHVYLQRKPGPWKPSLFCPSGWGGPALQEVPEKLKGTCGKLFMASPAKNNLWREQDSVYCPSPHRKPNESTLSDLPEAPVQGSQSPTLFCTPAPHSGLRASFSADSHPLPSTPLPGRHQPSEPWSPSEHPLPCPPSCPLPLQCLTSIPSAPLA